MRLSRYCYYCYIDCPSFNPGDGLVTRPRLSVVIPARNEEYYLPRALHAIRKSGDRLVHCDYEIVVVVNRSTDQTESIARENGCVVVKQDGKNLSAIRNAGVIASSGEFVITVDADSIVSTSMLPDVEKALTNQKIIGGGVLILPERWSLGILMTGLALVPIALWYRISCGLFFFRKTDFLAIGGFDEGLVSVEDIDFAKRLRAYGAATQRRFRTLFSSFITTSCRKFDKFGDWYFITNPSESLRLLGGKDQSLADKIWYDFER